jgi:hypothetical protein
VSGRPYGYVKKPILCPYCRKVVTAIPYDYQMWLTPEAAGFYPHGYRCKACVDPRAKTLVPQPHGGPKRLTEAMMRRIAETAAKVAA